MRVELRRHQLLHSPTFKSAGSLFIFETMMLLCIDVSFHATVDSSDYTVEFWTLEWMFMPWMNSGPHENLVGGIDKHHENSRLYSLYRVRHSNGSSPKLHVRGVSV